MRRTKFQNSIVALLLGLALQSAQNIQGQSPGSGPGSILPGSLVAIESIRLEGTNVVVTVDVSADVKSVVLESRLRVGGGSWDPRAVQRMSEFTTPVKAVTFRIPRTGTMELIRARGETTETLPATFFQGTNSIDYAISGVGGNNLAAAPPMATAVDDRAKVAAPAESTSGSAARSVVESDIWKLSGDTLYFFNQYRGLQVIDIAQPDKPVVRGTFDLPAAGEQMYLLGSNQVVLLARDNCNWGPTAESELMLLEVKNGQPAVVAELALSGQIRESRLVGTALYVVSERYQPFFLPAKPGDRPQEAWEWGSQVTSFDLSDFSKPVVKSKEWVSSGMYQNVNAIMATDQFLFVAAPAPGQNSWNGNSLIHVFDISAPDGTMQALSSISATGKVKDKFKMNLNGTTFSAVTETWNLTRNNPSTQVETYSLTDPKSPKQLAVLKIIEREQLHATRFDGDLLYAVTFFRIDPLWIIDLSDPANPQKVSELEIPGFSTYIQPLNGRLVTIGLDNTAGWRTAVQLFDVENPAKPSLLSKVILGEQYSSSEANYDEKAFGVLPDDKLLLVPYSTYGATGYFQGVHLIDLERDTLRKRGAIEHELQPRRATVHRDRILSVSGLELLSVDATDRDHPRVVSTTELSWAADRVYLEGSHLIEVSSQWNAPVSLRVVQADDPSKVLKQLSLSDVPFLGAAARDQRLYVAQGKSTEYVWEKDATSNSSHLVGTNDATLTLSVFDLSKLPEVSLLSQTKTKFGNRYWSSLTALWPKSGVLVWNSSAYGGPWRILAATPDVAIGAPGIAAPVDSRVAFAPWWGSSEALFLAYDVADAARPAFLSEVKVNGTNYWWSFSKAFAVDSLIYLSHQASEYLPYLKPPHWIDGTKPTIEPPPGVWAQRYFLDVINYADPKEPTVRKPVAIPGALLGVSRKGQLLYTHGYRYTDVEKWTDMREYLDAVAYDGVETHGVDSMLLPQTWPHPILASDAHLFIGLAPEVRATSTSTTDAKVVDATKPAPAPGSTSGTLEVWTLADTGKFVRLSSTALSSPANDLKKFGNLLAAQVNNKIQLYDATNPSDLKLRATGAPLGCIGYSMEFATGSLDRGLWIPLGQYGVTRIPIAQ
ncbi:MAG: beta-propeller domain-containing protein [Verrucomicrobia bacterium]|nr:beta-propeller domain-containing protein [Verrucomicrobiota bacterium]